jgi:hypothetical protein
VGHHDHLPLRLVGDEQPDQLVEDRLRVEVLFGLVNDQRVPPNFTARRTTRQDLNTQLKRCPLKPRLKPRTVAAIRAAFEVAGVEFIVGGVKLKSSEGETP